MELYFYKEKKMLERVFMYFKDRILYPKLIHTNIFGEKLDNSISHNIFNVYSKV